MRIFLAKILVFCSITGFAQSNFKFSHLTTEDGLPDNFSESVLEDHEGFLWIATNDGLCRYDGTEIKIFRNNPSDSNSISSNYIFELFEDSNQNLWIGTNMGGLSQYDRQQNRFINYFFTAEDKYWPKRNRINEIIEHNEFLWLASMYGLGRFNTETGESDWFIPQDKREGINTEQVMGILPDKKGNIWVGTLHGGLFYFDIKEESFTKQYIHSEKPGSISNNNIKSLYRDKRGTVFIATEEGGINIFDEETGGFKHLRHSANDVYSVSSDDVVCFYEDSKERFWVGTINGGLNLYDVKEQIFKRFQPEIGNDYGLNSSSILDIMEDSFGNVWFSTHAGGINCINVQQNTIEHISSANSPELVSNVVSSFCEVEDDIVYIGTDGGGLHVLDLKTMSLQAIPNNGGLDSKAILDIINAGNNLIWIATWGGGVSLFDCTTNSVLKQYRKGNRNNSLSIDDVKGLYLDGDTLWIAGHGGGVNILDIPSDKVTHYLNSNNPDFDMMRPEWGNEIVKDHEGNLWFASMVGLHKLHNGTLKSYLHDIHDINSLSGFIIASLFIDSQGTLWVGTDKGLDRYNPLQDNFRRISTLSGKIKAISEDNHMNLWISTNDGLFLYNSKEDKAKKFDEYDGLQGRQFIERASLKLSDKRLLFGGMNGFNIFHPDSLSNQNFNVSTHITQFLIYDKQQSPGLKGSILNGDINYTKGITLQYDQRVFAFEFSGINPMMSKRNVYFYKLDGFDTEWRMAGVSRKASYTNLDPGKYIFRVKTCMNGEDCGSPVKSIPIHIKAPWWLTLWFRVSAITLVVVTIILVYIARVISVQRQNIFLEKKVKKRTEQLQAALDDLKIQGEEILAQNENLRNARKELVVKNEELQVLNNTKNKFLNIIAHDIKSPLNSIIGFSELALLRFEELEPKKIHQFVSLINTSSNHLFDLVERLLQWARSQTNQLKISPEYFSIEELISSNKQLVKSMLDKKKISLSIDLLEDFDVYADFTMADTVLRNLLSNAIKFTPEEGNIIIKAHKGKNKAQISVIDSGIGMEDKIARNIFNPGVNVTRRGTNDEEGTGLGLLICHEFVKKNSGNIKVSSEFGRGTTISFSLPLGNNGLHDYKGDKTKTKKAVD